MSFYPIEISKRFISPQSVGIAESENANGVAAAFACGSILRLSLRIEEKQIREIKYKTNGCGFMIAAAEMIAESIVNTTIIEFNKSEMKREISRLLGNFPPDRINCLEVSIEALQTAFQDFRKTQIEEFKGEEALICTCFGVSESTIEELITKKHVDSVEEISEICNAGSGCGSCQPLIQEIIDSVN